MTEDSGGWMGKLLRVDLSRGSFERESIYPYASEFIGGRGIAARLAWQELKRGTAALSAENILYILTGPLTGTSAPYSGRTTLCSLAPQGYPVEWYTRSSFGGHWGPELKYAGWDGLVLTGKAPEPVYLWIDNDQVKIENAQHLWGRGIFETQQKLIERYGKKTRVLAIGPAAENLSRIAIAATETESASGQGGFGAIMGYKNLKAIAVRGTQPIKIAHPDQFLKICSLVRDECHASHGWPHPIKLDPQKVKKYGQRFQACTQQCHTGCYDARYYTRVPGVICNKMIAGQVDCVAGLFPGIKDTFYDWKLGFEAGFEITQMANDLGLNHWEILIGMVPWLRENARAGRIKKIYQRDFNLDDVFCWAELLHAITYRHGEIGNALSEGTVRGSQKLNLGQEFLPDFFPCWGYAGHWDGHGDHINHIVFPFWLVAALQWAMDTRDPISSGHGYTQNIMNWSKINSPAHGISWDTIMDIGQKIYGSKLAVDPRSSYQDKAYPAIWHNHRSVYKDSLPVDDQIFPRIYSNYTQDHYARSEDVEGIDFELHLLNAATGLDFSRLQFENFAEKVINLERLLLQKLHDRSRQDDETLIPYYEKPENSLNPLIGQPVSLNPEKFKVLMDQYYDLRGWDKTTGHPTDDTLKRLGLTKSLNLEPLNL
ncbi:aldehyde ferredoxin oxidoreductase N-terminal domain-containing protein [candidate division CSSED10-310 bacterium]|uniref:Aldehyde ferredoxin oxidoreductase N-terminal domain-containing protein n=1 Tax=candidate division CSSED10-310 bacterium TaxID=2855610 RepID=A0ABV6Z3V8_UNCC1